VSIYTKHDTYLTSELMSLHKMLIIRAAHKIINDVLESGFLQVFCSKILRLYPDFSSHGMTISLTLSEQ